MIITTEELKQLLRYNAFELFNIEPKFNIDLTLIRQTYLALQKKYHPDNAKNNEVLKSNLLMLSAHINDSFNVLQNPLDRSLKLLEIMNNPLDLNTDTILPPSFLITQIELNEQIEDAVKCKSIAMLEQIETLVKEQEAILIKQIEHNFTTLNLNEVKNNIKQLAFYQKVEAMLNANIMNLI